MTIQIRKSIIDMFIDDVRHGFTIAAANLLPNVVMVFVIIQALEMTGLLEVVGRVCGPVMVLQGLSGESATVLLATMMSMGGDVDACANLVVADTLSGHDATMLLPAVYLMDNPVQDVGCCLGTTGVHSRYCPLIIAICVINALLSTWVMQVIA